MDQDQTQENSLQTAKRRRHKNGDNGKRRGNGDGTLMKKGNTYYALFYIKGEDGVKRRVCQTTRTGNLEDARTELKRLAEKYATKTQAEREIEDHESLQDEKFVSKLIKAKRDIRLDRMEIEEKRKEEENAKPALSIANAFAAFSQSSSRKDCSERTLSDYGTQIEAFSDWMRKHHPDTVELRHVSKEQAAEFAKFLLESRSANTHNKYVTLLSYLWDILADEARIKQNPWKRITKKLVVMHVRRELTVEELMRVCDGLEGEMRILFAIGIYTGLRLGDCVMLKWGNVDLVRGFVSTSPRKTTRHSNGKIVTIPLHPTLAGMLADIPTEKRRGFILPETAEIYERNPSVLTNRIQKHFRSCGIQTGGKTARLYKKRGTYRFELQELDAKGHHIVEDTKLTDLAAARALFAKRFGSAKRDCVDVGFHSLRHTFVSLSANAGVPLAVVQAIVGHSNPVMTRHYFHASNEALKGAVAALPDVIDAEFKQVESAKPAENRSLSAVRKALPDLTDAELTELEYLLRSEIERRRTSASISH